MTVSIVVEDSIDVNEVDVVVEPVLSCTFCRFCIAIARSILSAKTEEAERRARRKRGAKRCMLTMDS